MPFSIKKYRCALREDGTINSTYGEFSKHLYEEILNTIANEPAVFPVKFIFVPVHDLHEVAVQSFVLLNVKKFKSLVRENFVILIKRKKKISSTLLHVAPDGEFIF